MSALTNIQANSKLQGDLNKDASLAEEYVAAANVRGLYELYQKRCKQLNEFVGVINAISEMYAEKGTWKDTGKTDDPSTVAAMERVTLATVDLAKMIVNFNYGSGAS